MRDDDRGAVWTALDEFAEPGGHALVELTEALAIGSRSMIGVPQREVEVPTLADFTAAVAEFLECRVDLER